MPIKVIDLFAGPGGLGEGFSSYRPKGKQAFKVAISIEKEESAHRTLHLRSFFRQFENGNAPEAYYEFLRGDLGSTPDEILYKLPELQEHLQKADQEAQCITLGEGNPQNIYKKIRDVLGKEECILIGGPPCQAYSLVGRSRNYGDKKKQYIPTNDHRNFLYIEYLKIISKFQPMIFVMENVKGMLSAKVDGKLIFESIIQDLQNPFKATNVSPDKGKRRHSYRIFSFVSSKEGLGSSLGSEGGLEPHDFVIRSENYGIPQKRHRVIILGIREDIEPHLGKIPRLETKNPTTVREVISDLPKLRSRLSKASDSVDNWRESIIELNNRLIQQLRKDRLVPQEVSSLLTKKIRDVRNSPEQIGSDRGLQKQVTMSEKCPKYLKTWYSDNRLGKFILNHTARGHIQGDLYRYLYYSTYAEVMNVSPKSHNLPKSLWPDHRNFGSGKFADRFRVQLASYSGTTVTSHISKDGHYFIHYDPVQCRSLTVREAARIQTFPDNYYFAGNRTQQYVQVGNAVPPFLAKQLAEVVFRILNV